MPLKLTIVGVLQNVAFEDTLPVVDRTEKAHSDYRVRLVPLKKAALIADSRADRFETCFEVVDGVLACAIDERLL